MQFLTGEQISTSTTKLFSENPNPPLHQVLADTDMLSTLRYEIPVIVNYFVRDDILKDLLTWALSTTYSNKRDFDRLQRASVLALSSPSKAFQDQLMENPIFIKTLQDTMKLELSKNLQLCGHFQRILCSMIGFTNGGFISNFPGLPTFLIQQVHILAFREFLLRLLTDFSDAFSETEYQDIVIKLCESAAYSYGFFSVTVVREVLNEKHEMIPYYQNHSAIKALLQAVTSRSLKHSFLPLFQATTFKVLESLANESESTQKLIARFASKFKFDGNNITCGTVAALRLFPQGLDALIDRFFESPPITILNEIIVNQVEKLEDEELGALVSKHNIVKKILAAYPTHKINGYLTELAIVLADRETACEELQSDEWQNFCDGPLRDIEEQRNCSDDDEGPAVTTILNQEEVNLQSDGHVSSDAAQTLKAAGLVASGHSFTIPTVYQAEINLQPMMC